MGMGHFHIHNEHCMLDLKEYCAIEKDLRDNLVFPFNITDEEIEKQKSMNLSRIKAKGIGKLRTEICVQDS